MYYRAGIIAPDGTAVWSPRTRSSLKSVEREARTMAIAGGRPVVESWERRHGYAERRPADAVVKLRDVLPKGQAKPGPPAKGPDGQKLTVRLIVWLAPSQAADLARIWGEDGWPDRIRALLEEEVRRADLGEAR